MKIDFIMFKISRENRAFSLLGNLAAIRQLFDYLVTRGILVSIPAGSARGPKHVVARGKTRGSFRR
jgi:site-specific recombinase XerC